MTKSTQRRKGSFWAYGCRGIRVHYYHGAEARHQAPGMVAETVAVNSQRELHTGSRESSFGNLKAYLSDILPPVKPHLLSLDKQGDQLVTKHSNA